jgi:hypothetical protein
LFETVFLVALTLFLAKEGYWLYALVAPGVSLLMYLIYLFAMDIPQSRGKQRPWGDTTILYSLATRGDRGRGFDGPCAYRAHHSRCFPQDIGATRARRAKR